ncbi:hypothetical protein B0H11DRAFT_1908486 [Mycena galericulata]|nr:hypothetical protein B0H11DRAFT_1908486 [Mycena galericulata]
MEPVESALSDHGGNRARGLVPYLSRITGLSAPALPPPLDLITKYVTQIGTQTSRTHFLAGIYNSPDDSPRVRHPCAQLTRAVKCTGSNSASECVPDSVPTRRAPPRIVLPRAHAARTRAIRDKLAYLQGLNPMSSRSNGLSPRIFKPGHKKFAMIYTRISTRTGGTWLSHLLPLAITEQGRRVPLLGLSQSRKVPTSPRGAMVLTFTPFGRLWLSIAMRAGGSSPPGDLIGVADQGAEESSSSMVLPLLLSVVLMALLPFDLGVAVVRVWTSVTIERIGAVYGQDPVSVKEAAQEGIRQDVQR